MTIHIFYATQTGNAADCAKTAQKTARERGLDALVSNLGDIDAAALSRVSHALFIVSTWGEGEAPDDAVPFFENLQQCTPGRFQHLRYGLFALGDSSYEHFCGFGKKMSLALNGCGASQVMPNVECDIQYEDELKAWLPRILDRLREPEAVSSPQP